MYFSLEGSDLVKSFESSDWSRESQIGFHRRRSRQIYGMWWWIWGYRLFWVWACLVWFVWPCRGSEARGELVQRSMASFSWIWREWVERRRVEGACMVTLVQSPMASLVGFGGGWWGSGAYKMQSTYSNGYPYLSGRCRFSLWLGLSLL